MILKEFEICNYVIINGMKVEMVVPGEVKEKKQPARINIKDKDEGKDM